MSLLVSCFCQRRPHSSLTFYPQSSTGKCSSFHCWFGFSQLIKIAVTCYAPFPIVPIPSQPEPLLCHCDQNLSLDQWLTLQTGWNQGLAAWNDSSALMAFWRSLVIRVPPRRTRKKVQLRELRQSGGGALCAAVPLDFVASSHNGVLVAGSHEGRKANPVLDLKPIDCEKRSRCELVSKLCRRCKLFLFAVCCQFIVCLWSFSPTVLNIAGHLFSPHRGN